jgi:hypothetical protein
MSMILGLTTVSDATIARLLADPPLVWRLLAPDDPDAYQRARQSARKPSWLGRLFGRPAPEPAEDADDGPELALADGEGETKDLDKAWHGIHYLLTGTAWEGRMPLAFLLAGGRPVGEVDVGYGPARALTASETNAAHQALSRLADDELRRRFDPADMMRKKIYPEIWDSPPEEDDTLSYLMENVQDLRGFLGETVQRGYGLLVSVT